MLHCFHPRIVSLHRKKLRRGCCGSRYCHRQVTLMHDIALLQQKLVVYLSDEPSRPRLNDDRLFVMECLRPSLAVLPLNRSYACCGHHFHPLPLLLVHDPPLLLTPHMSLHRQIF
jgi:hypothetical protein